MIRKSFTSVTTFLFLLVFTAPQAFATHESILTVAPFQILALPGDSVQYNGEVDATSLGCGITDAGTLLSLSGEPAGSIVTFNPSGSEVDDPPYNYTLDIDTPADAAPGPYLLEVNVDFFGPCLTVESRQANATLYLLAGTCPPGGDWFLMPALGPDDPYDMNGDGYICTLELPGQGQGNSANRACAAIVGHVDGHNHIDNNH